jgi:hypothetical protein
MARERKRGGGLAMVAAKQARVIARREKFQFSRQREKQQRDPWWQRGREPGRK